MGNEKTWNDLTKHHEGAMVYEKCSGFEVYRLPSRKLKILEFADAYFPKSGIVSKLIYLLINALGYFNAEADANASFRKILFEHLQSNKYDVIIVSSPPLNLIRLASDLKKRFNIPVHVDFRDLWNNGYLNEEYVPPFNLKWIDHFKRRHISRWMKQIDSYSTVSAPIANYLNTIFKKNCWVLTNGYDQDLYDFKNRKANEKFTITLMGSYYAAQQMDYISNGLTDFLKDKLAEKVKILLVGLNVHIEVLNVVEKVLPGAFITIVDRVNTDEAAATAINSDVILHASWKGYKGIYTTKLFDFIASGNNVLLAPGDDDVADALIKETGAGRIAENEGQVADILEEWYLEWISKGVVKYNGRIEEIKKYGRKNIALQFAELLKHKYG